MSAEKRKAQAKPAKPKAALAPRNRGKRGIAEDPTPGLFAAPASNASGAFIHWQSSPAGQGGIQTIQKRRGRCSCLMQVVEDPEETVAFESIPLGSFS